MDIQAAVQSQYLAALDMLQEAVSLCPPALWDDPADKNRFWHVAYHALYYTHLYLQPTENDFQPWAEHGERLRSLDPEKMDPQGKAAFTREEVSAYLDFCRAEVRRQVSALEPEAPSGFYWLPFDKLELQFYNLRHLMLHTGELAERLWERAQLEIGWVSRR